MLAFLKKHWFGLALLGVAVFFFWRLRKMLGGAPGVAPSLTESISAYASLPYRDEHEKIGGVNVEGPYGLTWS